MRRLFLIATLAAACSRGPAVPVNTQLWHLHGAWVTRGDVRVATGTVIAFRESGEYIEHTCAFLERADESVYISARGPHRVAVGRWKKSGREIVVTKESVARGASCGSVTYRIEGNSVVSTDGQYSPVTRLVSPDFESYLDGARRSGTRCEPVRRSSL